jgi:hypothetical protein
LGLIAKRRTKKPLVVTLHGYDILSEPSVGYGVRLDRRIDAIVRKVLSNADAIITASTATFNEALRVLKVVEGKYFLYLMASTSRNIIQPSMVQASRGYKGVKVGYETHLLRFFQSIAPF